MADIKSKEARSKNMAAIRSKDTKPEIYLRSLLFSKGYRYRKNTSAVYGHPDMFLLKHHVAIFVHGCFWHRHSGCKYAYNPKSRVDFWNEKFATNIKRDAIVQSELEKQGIRQVVIWECTVKKSMKDNSEEVAMLSALQSFLESGGTFLEL